MKTLAQVLFGAFLCLGVAAAQEHPMHVQGRPVTLITGIGNAHHPVSTHNPQAQQFFDQGLRFIYDFNHDEAARSFQHAAELDPRLAMAYWGVAEAVGPNYNDPADPERYKQAHEAVQKAVDLSASASESDQAYVQALAKRFPADSKSLSWLRSTPAAFIASLAQWRGKPVIVPPDPGVDAKCKLPFAKCRTMKAFLTGATGFLGSHVARVLAEQGADLRLLVRFTVPRSLY